MKNTIYEGYMGPRLERSVQLRRIRNVIRHELTPRQRMIFTAIYLEGRTITALSKELGINKSSVCRTFHRAERIIRQHLRY